MNVCITHYDDITTPQGEIITMYMINVQYSTHASYNLAKRYSDFATLHSIVKDALPSDYKFPNKSLFNNNAQFTKERRIRGFDELLKLLAKHQPFDPNFQAFLEMKQHISPSDREAMVEQMRTQNLDSHSGGGSSGSGLTPNFGGPSRRAVIKSVSLKSGVDLHSIHTQEEDIRIRQKLSYLSDYLYDKIYETEDNLCQYEITMKEKENNFKSHFHRELPKLMITILKTSLIIYGIIFILGIIDLFHIHFAKTFYSFTSLNMILLFVEVKKIRKAVKRANEDALQYGCSGGGGGSEVYKVDSSSTQSSPSKSKENESVKEEKVSKGKKVSIAEE